MTEKTPPTPKAKPTPEAALSTALDALLKAGTTYATSTDSHVHQIDVGDFRLRFVADEIASITRR